MVDWGGKVAAWFAAVASVSAALAALIAATARQPLHGMTHVLFVVLVGIAVVSFVMLLMTGPRALWAWWRNRRRAGLAHGADQVKPFVVNGDAAGPQTHPSPDARSARDLGPLRSLITQGKAMQVTLGPPGNWDIMMEPSDEFNARLESWMAQAEEALRPWPGCYEQFRGRPPQPFLRAMQGRMAFAYDRIEQGIKVLQAILDGSETR